MEFSFLFGGTTLIPLDGSTCLRGVGCQGSIFDRLILYLLFGKQRGVDQHGVDDDDDVDLRLV